MYTIIIFWFSVGIILYVYIIYPFLIAFLAKLRTKPAHKRQIYPSVTLLVAAYNEDEVIREKIENSLNLDYPKDKLEIAILADGSTDKTCSIVKEYAGKGVWLYYQSDRKGKTAALNRVVPLTHGEIILFSDANNIFRLDVVSKLACNFADPNVGAVTGKKILFKTKSALGESENLYWRYESLIRTNESQFNSTTGVVGEILAVRRELYAPLSESVINDDFFIAMEVIKRGYRVIYEPEAISEEMPSASIRDESVRRARISAGYYQLIGDLLLLVPSAPFFVFQAVSHKFLRPFIPFFMIIAFLTNIILATQQPFTNNKFIFFIIGQAFFYFFAFFGGSLYILGIKSKLLYVPFYFCITNFSYIVGFYKFLFGRQTAIWEKALRESKQGASKYIKPLTTNKIGKKD